MKIAVLGGGAEGISLVRYFSEKRADISLYDKNYVEPSKIRTKNIKTKFGPHYLDDLGKFDVVFRSPGIPFFTPALQIAVKNGVNITSLTKYFFEHCPCPVIGVTGTKGKGTVATLLHEIFKTAGKSAYLGGNMGLPPLEFLDELRKKDTVILELSSFQLQDLNQSPHVAVVLPVSQDHLDHHKKFEEYVDAKKNIVRFQKPADIAVGNIDDELTKTFLKISRAMPKNKYEVSLLRKVKHGAYMRDDGLFLSGGKPVLFGKFSETKLAGKHNAGNILLAACAARAFGIDDAHIWEAVKKFAGLPHRLEFVREMDKARYYNDSASTNPETCIAALRTFSQPTILIAGGSEKHLDYDPLGEEIIKRENLKTVVLMGHTKPRIEKAIDTAERKFGRKFPLEIISAENYPEAFLAARALAQPGDVVLFSPASASFDMFPNYQERGMIFKKWVLSL